MVSGSVVSSMITLLINTYYTGKLINVGFVKQMGDLFPIFGLSVAMWIAVHGSLLLMSNLCFQLIISIFIGVIFYILGAKFFLKTEWQDAKSMIPSRFKHKTKKYE